MSLQGAGCLCCVVLAGCANLGGDGDSLLASADAGMTIFPGPDGSGAGARTDAAGGGPEKDGSDPDRAAGGDTGAGRADSGETGSGGEASSGGGGDSGEEADSSGIHPDGGDSLDAADPLSFPARCTSGKTWNGVTGDQNMRPGESCPTCHANFELAGTLYPTGHEPNDCDGVDGLTTGVTIVVTDATGLEVTLFPNMVGNFFTSVSVTPPFHAKVVVNGKERAMTAAQTSGACNMCHTQTGANGAPGRITLPP
jgi:hypothetical protein